MCMFNTIKHHEGEEYWAEVPALPGCYAMARSESELVDNIREAIKLHLSELNAMCSSLG